jgi:clan AA aspartic protease (TIGR02281 family)
MKIEDGKLTVKVELCGKDSSLATDALIDTGAAFTVIPRGIADFLKLEADRARPRARLITASGVIEAPRMILRKVKLDRLEVKDLPAVVHDLPAPAPIKVLLGMSFVNKIRLEIDGKGSEFFVGDP